MLHSYLFTIFLIFGNSLNGDFLFYDDLEGFINDSQVKNLSASLATLNLFTIYKALVFKFFGMSNQIFHIFSLLFHALNSFILYLIAKKLIDNKYAIMSAVLFAVHPVTTETVSWISGSLYLLYGFFSLLTIYLFINYRQSKYKKWLVFSVITFVLYLAFVQTPWAVTTLLIVIAIDLFYFKNRINLKSIKIYSLYLLPFVIFALTIIPIIMRSRAEALEGMASSIVRPSFFVLKGMIIQRSLNLSFFPFNLYIFPNPIILNTATYFLITIAIATLLFLFYFLYKHEKKLFTLFLCAYLSVLPLLLPFDVGADASERYFYLSSAFMSLFFILTFIKLEEKFKKQNLLIPLFIFIFFIFATRTFIRTFDWKGDESLLLATTRTSKNNYKGYVNLGVLYHQTGNLEKSLESYQTALRLNPNSYEAVHNIGSLYAEVGNYAEAKKYIEAVYRITPNNYLTLYKLGTIEQALGNIEKAREYFNKALEINPRHEPSIEALKIINQ